MVYDSYGNMTSDTGSVQADYVSYTGREAERDIGIYYYRARYYDPLTGRFIVKDPLGLVAGDINLYRYVGNNPVNFNDPFGLRIDWNNKNPTNPAVRENLIRLNQGIIDQGYPDESFTIYVTTVDRYINRSGAHTGFDTGNPIPGSVVDSPHLISRGARAVDFDVLGLNVSNAEKRRIVDCALKSNTCFDPKLTRPKNEDGKTPVYVEGGHIHIALPFTARFSMPYYSISISPEVPQNPYGSTIVFGQGFE